ncbi:hypothetical protein JCM10213_006919, partial [Rhodosporidiobolus nylandii]
SGAVLLSQTDKPKPKAIRFPHEWSKAWDECAKVALALYDFRDREFKVYRKHLLAALEDDASEPGTFRRWLDYDSRYRRRLGQEGRPDTLDAVVRDVELKFQVFNPSSALNKGGGSSTGGGGGGGSGKKKPRSSKGRKRGQERRDVACDKHNAGKCKKLGPGEECPNGFGHFCSRCRSTAHVSPLPRPPSHISLHPDFLSAIRTHPHLFNFTRRTPFRTELFAYLLLDNPKTRHPNRPLVLSVVEGLRFGFWLGFEGTLEDLAGTRDLRYENEKDGWIFITNWMDGEAGKERMGVPFRQLLPGMVSSPAVRSIPEGRKARVVVDQSQSGLNGGVSGRRLEPSTTSRSNWRAASVSSPSPNPTTTALPGRRSEAMSTP